MKHPYADILEHPYPFPTGRPRMSREARAAQFSPFAALTGYEQSIAETARLTVPQRIPAPEALEELNRKLLALQQAGEVPVRLTYFIPDPRKPGGTYATAEGIFRKVDPIQQILWLTDHRGFWLQDLWDIESPIL